MTYGWNRKNVDTFIKNLNDSVNGIDVALSPPVEKLVKEWTLAKILMRLIAYPFCLFIIVFSSYLILDGQAKMVMLWGIIIPCIFLYSDLKIILGKRN